MLRFDGGLIWPFRDKQRDPYTYCYLCGCEIPPSYEEAICERCAEEMEELNNDPV